MAPKQLKNTGLGADAFFQTSPASKSGATASAKPVDDRIERRSFNLKSSTVRLLDEVMIKTLRDGDKWTLSAIVERGIELAAREMGISDEANGRAHTHANTSAAESYSTRVSE